MDLPSCGLKTTLSQAQEIIKAIYNVTDGIPQIPYLVGWQYDGHDTGYPSMDKVNDRVGGANALRDLFYFIPRDGSIYAYSLNGSERDWILPEEFRDRNLQAFTLSKGGRGSSPEYRIKDGKIWLKLDPKTPIKIIIR